MAIQSGAQAWDLTTLEVMQEYLTSLGITTDDGVIQRMISAMSSAVYEYLNRNVLLSGSVV